MMEIAKFTNILTINYFIVRMAESLCKGHLVDLDRYRLLSSYYTYVISQTLS